jgi:parvulin-like peptidyl-prolyl isomerase
MKRHLTPLSRFWLPALGAIILACGVAPVSAEIIERVIVKVNGEIFTKTDLEARQVAALRERGGQQLSDAELKKRVEAITPQLLVDAVDEMLLLQRGKELGYRMTDDQFNEILTKLKADNKIETEEQFQAALKQEGLTLPELRKQIERNMIVQRVEQNEVVSHLSVSNDEARKYYDDHKAEFTSTPTVTLREILVKVPSDGKSVNVGADEEAKAKAEAIRERALKGESFENLTQLSDAPSKNNGGLVGPINRSDLNPAFAQQLATMKVGDISPVLRTATGSDIVKLESSTETRVLPFEEARNQIANKVYQAKQQAEFENYIRKLRAAAIIDWKVPELKKLYDEQVARMQAPQTSGPSQ